MSGKPLVSVVSISQNVRKAKAFEVEMPFKEIQFNFPGNLQDYASPWHTHLGLYRNTQTERRNTGTAEESAKTMDSGEQPSPTADPSLPQDISLSCQQAAYTSEGASQSDVPDRMGDSLTHRPRKLSTPAIQTGQQSLVAYKPPSSTKLLSYPFPQKKCPKKSEAARRLGLYAAH
ncbi:hypothetical protein AOXY_G4447 [Acipenser oxyrinchus oxyrinchus]|uniref:TBC1 domain-containing protein n=1 Tax=Acipenser oxyrinchus oxyrinchus TaxID=40147 RepID=A0AAD8GD18_ACIOX|nr:hypothetical protein AOXY_G4447 [Acipenser oxyrinchus oxyrinchus]